MALTKVTGQVIKNTTDVTVGVLTVTNTLAVGGTVSIGGTLTYEDVTNVDAVGLITARNGIVVGSGITLSKDGDIFATGVTTTGSLVSNGVIKIPDGSTSAPSITAASDTNSGLYFAAADALGLVVGGSRKLLANSSGITVNNGDLTIDDKIIHSGDTDTAIRFSAADTIQLETGGAARFTVGGGNVVQQSGTLYVKNATGDSNGLKLSQESGDESRIFNHYSGALTFGTANTERARIDSTGRLLLNTTTEGNAGADDFTIGQISGSTGITIRSGTTNNGNLYFSDGTSGDDEYRGSIQYQHANNSLHIATNAVERLIIKSDGKVGVGNASPTFLLDVKGATTDTFRISNSNESSHGDVDAKIVAGGSYYQNIRSEASNHKFITFDGSSTYERLRITSAGAVLIGDTTATSQNDRLLQIGKTDRGATYLELRTSTSGAGGIVFSDGTAADSTGYRGTFEYVHSSDYMIFKTAATEDLEFIVMAPCHS